MLFVICHLISSLCPKCCAYAVRMAALLQLVLAGAFAARSGWFVERADSGERIASFNAHMLGMILAWLAMTEGVLAWATWERGAGLSHANTKTAHAGFNLLGIAFATWGLVSIFRNHAVKGIPPLYSAHSWLGVFAVSMVALAALGGVACFLLGNLLGISAEVRKAMLPWHRMAAVMGYFAGLLAMLMGIQEKQGWTDCADGGARCTDKTLLGLMALATAALGAAVAARLAADSEAKRRDAKESKRLLA